MCACSSGRRVTRAGESRRVGVALTGDGGRPHWSGGRRTVDFFDVKGIVEAIAEALQVEVTFDGATRAFVSRARPRRDSLDRRTAVGGVGMLAPAIVAVGGTDANEDVYVAELDLDALTATRRAAPLTVAPLPRYPVDRARHLDRRRRHLARGNGSWHYPCGCAGHARVGARVRSLSRQGRARRARQPLASPDVPLSRADADRRGSGNSDESDYRGAEKRASTPVQRSRTRRRFPYVPYRSSPLCRSRTHRSPGRKSQDARRDDRPAQGRSGARRRRKRAAVARARVGRAQIAESETGLAEVAALRSERETIRGRVSGMLEQLEG